MKALSSVTELRETKSKYDYQMKNHMIRFQIKPCDKGVDAVFVAERKLRDTIPKFIAHAIPGPEDDTIVHIPVVGECFSLKWYHKLFRISLQSQVEKWAKARIKELEAQKKSEEKAEQLRTAIG